MNNLRVLLGRLGRLQLRLVAILSLLVCINLCAAVSANAQQSNAASEGGMPAGNAVGMIDAVVIDVQGTTLKIEGGILIDISAAAVFQFTAGRLDPSVIKPGMCIRVSFTSSSDASAPLVADYVRIRVPNELVLSGLIQAVDLQNGFITLLNRQIPIGPSAVAGFGSKQLKHLKVGRLVTVIATPDGTGLVAVQIFPDLPLPRILP